MEQVVTILHSQLQEIREDLKELREDVTILKERKPAIELRLPNSMKEWTILIVILSMLGLVPAGAVETLTHITSDASASSNTIQADGE